MYQENTDAAKIYELAKNQVVKNGGMKELEGGLVLKIISLYKDEIEDPQDCFVRVLAASRTILNA